jgi:hypothetical protein
VFGRHLFLCGHESEHSSHGNGEGKWACRERNLDRASTPLRTDTVRLCSSRYVTVQSVCLMQQVRPLSRESTTGTGWPDNLVLRRLIEAIERATPIFGSRAAVRPRASCTLCSKLRHHDKRMDGQTGGQIKVFASHHSLPPSVSYSRHDSLEKPKHLSLSKPPSQRYRRPSKRKVLISLITELDLPPCYMYPAYHHKQNKLLLCINHHPPPRQYIVHPRHHQISALNHMARKPPSPDGKPLWRSSISSID